MFLCCKRRNDRTIGLILMMVIVSSVAYGQREGDKKRGWSFSERLYFGGGIDLGTNTSGGEDFLRLSASPIVGYMITSTLSAGLGVQWTNISYLRRDVSINEYGGTVFVRRNFSNLFVYGEYNLINAPTTIVGDKRLNFSRLPLGLGWTEPLGETSAINFLAMYDVLYSQSKYIFRSPWVFRIYFAFSITR